MVASSIWNTSGAIMDDGNNVNTLYMSERSTRTGKICVGTTWENGNYCKDTVQRKIIFQGYVGLIYPSDYVYASKDNRCALNNTVQNTYCKNENWLYKCVSYWTITPFASVDWATDAWLVSYNGNLSYASWDPRSVFPSLYLKSTIKITSGDGTESNPYKLSI